MAKIIPIFFYLALALGLWFAGYLAFIGARNTWRGLASPRWPKTSGVVTTSDLAKDVTFNKKTSHNDVEYGANLAIRYNVNERDYTTSLLFFGQTLGSGDPTEAQLRHLRFPQGAEVSVSYNPGDPSIAAVEPGFHAESLWILIAGLFFGLPCFIAGVIYGSSLGGGNDNLAMAIGASVFASLFAIGGVAALTFGLINLWHGYVSQGWPKTPGVITYQMVDASEVETTEPSSDSPYADESSKGNSQAKH